MDITPDAGFSTDEVLTQAQGNVTGFGLALLRYARERGETPETVARWLGELFAPGWGEELPDPGVRQVARMAALNLVSGGAVLQGLTGGDERAEVTVAGWPGEEDLAFFGVSRDEADATFGIFEPIAAHLGLRYRWQRQGDAVTMTFERGTG